MTVEKSTRRVYSAEELYRLRGTSSQPKLREAIEEHDGEDAELVKEHVLRGSKSFAARSFRSRASGNSLRVPLQKENRSTTDADNSRQSINEEVPPRVPVLGEIQPNNQVLRSGLWRLRPSPTPTLTKKAAEAIVKAHGSPQHVRVTAGGRIVPSEQSPLCHPRYGYSAIKANGGLVKFAPNHPMGQKQQWTQATQNGFVAQDMEGRLCQIVNGTILPLNEVDGALRLYMPAPNLNIDASRNTSFGPTGQARFSPPDNQPRDASQGSRPPATEPSSAAQANALELEYTKLEQELRDLDKTEVIHGRGMSKVAKDALVSKRRELVVSMDNIRRAIKGLKSQAPSDAPTSPRAMQPNRQSASPPGRNRLPPFLKHRMNESTAPPMQSAFSGFLSALPGHAQSGPFGFQPSPSPDAQFVGQPFGMPPAGVFVPPPPFDGSMGQAFAPFPVPNTTQQPNGAAPKDETHIPQTDGAWSYADRQKMASPRASRAVDIKAPAPKQTAGLKSTLNPMSPAYKPGFGLLANPGKADLPVSKSVKDRAPTPLSPLHQLRAPASATVKNPNVTDSTISPTKRSPHLHSSSVSSFQTADFFPRNTREYSTRKDEYPETIANKSEDKENFDPRHTPTTPEDHDSGYTASDPITLAQTPGFGGHVAPPGTPMTGQATNGSVPISFSVKNVPNRQIDNISPKGKNWTFVQEHPGEASSSSMVAGARQELCVTVSPEKLDFTQASVEWIEGYRSGLSCKPVGADRGADFMDGYCAGVLKSKPTINGPSTGSPKRAPSRRPSPANLLPRSGSHQKLERRDPTPVRPMLENTLQSMDTLKEAIFAPNNESAILTPAPEGPHINDTSFNLGAWAKHNSGEGLAGFPFPDRRSSTMHSEGDASGMHAVKLQRNDSVMASSNTNVSRSFAPSDVSMNPIAIGAATNNGNRVTSMTSIDTNLYRQYPGHRVFSPHLEWRSSSSVARAAGVATGSFTNSQFDGSNNSVRDQPSSTTGVAQLQQSRITSSTGNSAMVTHSRFREASLDGLTDPTVSPTPMSPPMSPSLPSKDNASPNKVKKNSSPAKTGSPAKAKFENIAEKVGIKVAKDNSPNSPPGKRRWRNVWLGGKKEGSRDDGT